MVHFASKQSTVTAAVNSKPPVIRLTSTRTSSLKKKPVEEFQFQIGRIWLPDVKYVIKLLSQQRILGSNVFIGHGKPIEYFSVHHGFHKAACWTYQNDSMKKCSQTTPGTSFDSTLSSIDTDVELAVSNEIKAQNTKDNDVYDAEPLEINITKSENIQTKIPTKNCDSTKCDKFSVGERLHSIAQSLNVLSSPKEVYDSPSSFLDERLPFPTSKHSWGSTDIDNDGQRSSVGDCYNDEFFCHSVLSAACDENRFQPLPLTTEFRSAPQENGLTRKRQTPTGITY